MWIHCRHVSLNISGKKSKVTISYDIYSAGIIEMIETKILCLSGFQVQHRDVSDPKVWDCLGRCQNNLKNQKQE